MDEKARIELVETHAEETGEPLLEGLKLVKARPNPDLIAKKVAGVGMTRGSSLGGSVQVSGVNSPADGAAPAGGPAAGASSSSSSSSSAAVGGGDPMQVDSGAAAPAAAAADRETSKPMDVVGETAEEEEDEDMKAAMAASQDPKAAMQARVQALFAEYSKAGDPPNVAAMKAMEEVKKMKF